jgi:hypothetical protein
VSRTDVTDRRNMATTKRTTAKYATDIFGQKIRLLATKLSADRGHNRLNYSEVRRAVSTGDGIVLTQINYGIVPRGFGLYDTRLADNSDDGAVIREAAERGPLYHIGCHVFSLAQFNRILRAAGVDTSKTKTARAFAKGA